jgi:hypothetical protein
MHSGSRWFPLTAVPSALVVEPPLRSADNLQSCPMSKSPRLDAGGFFICTSSCSSGSDSMLLVYELQNGAWKQALRWQSPPLKSISAAFGDFFVSALLRAPHAGGPGGWRVAVAHGTPWCQSRLSAFEIDLLSPGAGASSPKQVRVEDATLPVRWWKLTGSCAVGRCRTPSFRSRWTQVWSG